MSAARAETDDSGIAKVTATANQTAGGPSVVTASVGGLPPEATFSLTNTADSQAAAPSIAVSGGDCQTAITGTAFTTPLTAVVTAFGKPQAGVPVTFSVPANGASATFSPSATVQTDAQGVGKVTATANATPGSYKVTISAPGVSAMFSSLTNAAANPARNWDDTCNPVMDAVVANTGLDTDVSNTDHTQRLEYLSSCAELLLRTIHVLGQSDTTTTRGQLANPPVTSDTTKVFAGASELDPFYFGWNKGDVYNDALVRISSNLSLLADRVYSNNHNFWPPIGHSARLTGETKRAALKLSIKGRTPLLPLDKEFVNYVVTSLSDAHFALTTIMENNGLTEPFSGLLETYVVPYSTAGSNGVPSALSSLNQSNQTFAAGFLSFESDHFRPRVIQIGEMSIGGRVGLLPVETLVTVSGTDSKPRAYLQNAFHWDLNVRGSERWGSRTLVAALVSFGQNILLSNSSVITPATQSPASSAQTPAAANTTSPFGNTQSGAWFFEGGPELRIYPYQMQRVNDEKRFLLPSFSFSTGIRLDARFSGLNTLFKDQNGAAYGDFWKPTQRWFLRAFVTLTNVLERNPSQKSNSGLFNVGLGFEYDNVWGFPGAGRLVVPADSKIYINGSIDLVKAFSKQSGQ